jgi:hypothetical protein
MQAKAKIVIRILLIMAFLFVSGNFLMAKTLAPAHPQTPTQKIQKPAAPARQPSAATVESDDPDQEGQTVAQPSDQKILNDMREQLDREAMERVRNGGYRQNTFLQVFDDFGGFLIFLSVAGFLLWLIRTALEHRRWHKMVKVQTETHTKLLDKFGSSQELLTYMDSEAGKRFLETPVFDAQNKRTIAMPYSRILWSVQIGVIAAVMGAGFLSLRGKVIANPDSDMGLLIFGTILLALGIGFLVSGGVSYLLAKYMGLLKNHGDGLARSSAHSSSS